MLPVFYRKGVPEKGFLSMSICEFILRHKKLERGFKRMKLNFGQEEKHEMSSPQFLDGCG